MKRPELAAASHGPAMRLSCLPPDLLLAIFRHLSAHDLAAIGVQDQYLRQVAADASLWAPLALGRWPGADADAGYDGNWHALFLARAYMPHAFPLAADRVRAVTAVQRQQRQAEQHAAPAAVGAPSATSSSSSGSSGAGAMPALAFEDVMRQAFSVGLACTRDSSVRRTAEWRALKQDLTWWAAERPEVLVAFARSTHDALAGGGGWAAGRRFEAWRRSSIAFLLDLGLLGGAHASVAARVAAEASALDAAMRRAHQAGGGSLAPAAPAPADVPTSHWWHFG